MPQQVFVNALAKLATFGAPFGEKLFVLGSALAGFFFFFLNFGGFGFQFGLRSFDFFVARVGVDHQLENLVFVGGDLFFGELDFVQQSFVLFVGLYVEGLVAVLGNLAAEFGDGSVVLAAGGFVGLDGGLGFFELGFDAGQLLLDHGDALGKFGDLVLQTADFLVRILKFQEVFYFWKHPAGLILAREEREFTRVLRVKKNKNFSPPGALGFTEETLRPIIPKAANIVQARALGVYTFRSPVGSAV